MTLRAGHGAGAGQPRIEVLPAGELPAGVPAPEAGRSGDGKRPDGTFAPGAGARAAGAKGGKRNGGRSKLATALGFAAGVEDFDLFRRSAKAYVARQCSELAQTVGGGELGIAPSACVGTAALQLAGSRYLFERAAKTGDPKLFESASRLGNDARQNLLAAWELAAKQTKTRPQTSPHAALADALGSDDEPEDPP